MGISMATQSNLNRLIDFVASSQSLLLLSGAGLSTSSGIPAYRDREGVRRGRAPIQGQEFLKSELTRKRYWARSMVGWPALANAEPNAGHKAIADLQVRRKISGVITQNVDGLHSRAGNANVLELHGNIHSVICLNCGSRFSRRLIQFVLEKQNPSFVETTASSAPDGDAYLEAEFIHFQVPHCLNCEGTLKPDIVFFGDGVPRWRTEEAEAKLLEADGILVIGSSLMVYSGYRLCKIAAQANKLIAAVNLGKTRADELMAIKIEGAAEHFLPLLAQSLLET